jgi:predicted RNA-binding protein YlqC (UPF0109 family)
LAESCRKVRSAEAIRNLSGSFASPVPGFAQDDDEKAKAKGQIQGSFTSLRMTERESCRQKAAISGGDAQSLGVLHFVKDDGERQSQKPNTGVLRFAQDDGERVAGRKVRSAEAIRNLSGSFASLRMTAKRKAKTKSKAQIQGSFIRSASLRTRRSLFNAAVLVSWRVADELRERVRPWWELKRRAGRRVNWERRDGLRYPRRRRGGPRVLRLTIR